MAVALGDAVGVPVGDGVDVGLVVGDGVVPLGVGVGDGVAVGSVYWPRTSVAGVEPVARGAGVESAHARAGERLPRSAAVASETPTRWAGADRRLNSTYVTRFPTP